MSCGDSAKRHTRDASNVGASAKDTFRSLAPLVVRVFAFAAVRYACTPFALGNFEEAGLNGGFSGAELSASFSVLRKEGLADAYLDAKGQIRYRLTPAALRLWIASLPVQGAAAEGSGADTDAENRDAVQQGAAFAFFRFLSFVGKNPVELTRTGRLPKPYVMRWARQLEEWAAGSRVCGVGTEGNAKKKRPQEGVLLRAAEFHWQAARKLGLVSSGAGPCRLQAGALKRWLLLPPEHMSAELYRLWSECGLPDTPYGQLLLFWVEQCAVGRFTPADIIDGLFGCGLPPALEEEHTEAAALEVLDPLVQAGWIRKENTAEGAIVFRGWLPVERAFGMRDNLDRGVSAEWRDSEEGWFVQPDFEVLIPGTPGFLTLWEMELMAELAAEDTVRIYRLTRESWHRALSAGRDEESCLHFLEQRSLYGIPENVRRALREWAVLSGAAGGEGVGNTQGLPGRKAPFYPDLTSPTDEEQGTESRAVPAGTCERLTPDAHRSGTRELGIPGADELLPGLREIPSAWVKSSREYHLSTRREIVRQAMEWRTFLLLKDLSGDRKVLPVSVMEEGGRWKLEGRENGVRIEIDAEQWGGMQIVLPETGFSWYDRR